MEHVILDQSTGYITSLPVVSPDSIEYVSTDTINSRILDYDLNKGEIQELKDKISRLEKQMRKFEKPFTCKSLL